MVQADGSWGKSYENKPRVADPIWDWADPTPTPHVGVKTRKNAIKQLQRNNWYKELRKRTNLSDTYSKHPLVWYDIKQNIRKSAHSAKLL